MKPRIVRSNVGTTKTAAPEMFVGHVLHDQIFVPEAPSRLRVSRVTFTPGGRTNWHAHAVGHQVEEIRAGDTVIIPANARHWHGAAPDQIMCHLALSETDDTGATAEWLEPVSETDYTAPIA
jgi:quercetin dioxygenase-like cupin family protein